MPRDPIYRPADALPLRAPFRPSVLLALVIVPSFVVCRRIHHRALLLSSSLCFSPLLLVARSTFCKRVAVAVSLSEHHFNQPPNRGD